MPAGTGWPAATPGTPPRPRGRSCPIRPGAARACTGPETWPAGARDGILEFVGRAGRPGQDPRVPSRARRGRGGPAGASGRAGVGRRGRRPGRAAAPDRLRDARGRRRILADAAARQRCATSSRSGCPTTWCRPDSRPSPDSRSTPAARSTERRSPRPTETPAGRPTPPRGATEERLADIWQRLLPENGSSGGDVGREDSFFALGGDSLLGGAPDVPRRRGVRRRTAPGRVLRGPHARRLRRRHRRGSASRQAAARAPRPDTVPSGIAAGTAAPTAWPPRSPHRTIRAWWRPTREWLTEQEG